MDENLLLHILTGEATIEEKEAFYRLIDEDKEERELYFEVKSLWLQTSSNHTKADAGADFQKVLKMIGKRRQNNFGAIRRNIIRVAAIMLIVLGIGGAAGYFMGRGSVIKSEIAESGVQKFTATRGSVSIVEFPDGTRVWLNSESHLSYYEDYAAGERRADLTGEAYFEVTHRDDFPLVVKAGNLFVRDLGTTFNIKAYSGDNCVETSLVEGAADILSSSGKQVLSLKPGESALYHTDENRIELRKISENVLSAWRDGKFVIRDQRLEDIFRELARWYGIEFRFENDKLREYRFTGNIKKTTTAQHVLKMLKTTTAFNYRIIENTDQPDVVIVY